MMYSTKKRDRDQRLTTETTQRERGDKMCRASGAKADQREEEAEMLKKA